MAKQNNSIAHLADRGDMKNLDDRWLSAIEQPEEHLDDLLATLDVLIKHDKADKAAELAWTWLSTEKERSEAAEVLKLAREIGLRCKDSEELREELVSLYEDVYADRDELSSLMEASGLKGDKTIRRALRTLDICLGLKVGDFLITRSDEQVAQVTEIDWDLEEYTIRTARGMEDELDPDAIALKYDPVDEHDFRVLVQMRPELIQSLIDSDPAALIMGVLRSHQNRMDSDYLEHLLSPRFVPTNNWKKWWTRAKTAIKRCPNIVMEGKNPIILTYNEEGYTLEDEIVPEWKKAESPAQRLSVIDTYFREAKTRKHKVDLKLIERFHKTQIARFKSLCNGAPVDALVEALIADRLAEDVEVPGREGSAAETLLGTTPDVTKLFVPPLKDMSALYQRALVLLRSMRPDDWPDIYATILPTAPVDACEMIAKALRKEGRTEQLAAVVQEIPQDFNRNLDAICWLWRHTKSAEGLGAVSPRELLPRLLNHLAELTRSDNTPIDVLRDARQKIRSALSAGRYKHYREVIQEMDANMAATIRRAVERLDGLGQVCSADLLRIIRETHPELYAKARIDPWFDDGILFATQAGLEKRQEELDYLRNVKMKENAVAIGEAASRGDLSENSEYKFALEERDLLQARAAKIQDEINIARVLEPLDIGTDRVNIGTRVELKQAGGDAQRRITILGPFEADFENNVLNYKAPMAAKLKGLKVGDRVPLEQDGQEQEFEIVSIENALT